MVREIETIEAGTAQCMDGTATENLRRRLMAADATGYLQRARRAALHAVGRARTQGERYRVAALMVMIECEAGHHKRELQEAQLMVSLQPRNYNSWQVLRRARVCNGGHPLRTACPLLHSDE